MHNLEALASPQVSAPLLEIDHAGLGKLGDVAATACHLS
jgi:hypothetical protein